MNWFIVGSLLVFPLSKTVVNWVGLHAEHQSGQQFRQRLPAGNNISGMVQFRTFILPLLYACLE